MDEFHYQEDYFNRLIKRKTGLTYSAYVQQIRLERAEHLLVSTDKSIEAIADSVGYHNKGYFYKLFQEKYEETPACKQYNEEASGKCDTYPPAGKCSLRGDKT